MEDHDQIADELAFLKMLDMTEAKRTCKKCGYVYSMITMFEDHMLDYYLYGYWEGIQDYCIACWAGVGPNDPV